MSDKKLVSILELHKCMQSALRDRSDYAWLISKCSNQALLASIERKSSGIVPMTLNTFKKYANENINGGFEEIDRIRKRLKSILNSTKVSKSTKLKDAAISCKDKLDEAERMRAILVRAYSDLNRICMDAISRSPEYQYDYDRHKEIYSKYFGIHLVKNNE